MWASACALLFGHASPTRNPMRRLCADTAALEQRHLGSRHAGRSSSAANRAAGFVWWKPRCSPVGPAGAVRLAFNTGPRGRMHGGPGLLGRMPGGIMGPSQRQRRFRRSARSGLRIPTGTVDSSMAGPPTGQTCGPATMVRLLKSAVARPGRRGAQAERHPGAGLQQGA